jgi:hypothetical protein
MSWRTLRVSLLVVVPVAVVAHLVCFDPLELRVTDKERIPGDTETLSDEAVRVKDPDGFTTKATLGLPDGGLLEFSYCPIGDSGVQVRRLDRPGGSVVWEQECDPLGVCHSKYKHEVVVHIEGRTARIISRGSYGAFVERLDLDSGRSLARSVRKSEQNDSFVGRLRRWLGLAQ